MTGASPKSTTRSSAKASILTSRCGPGGELAPRIARGANRAPGRSETRSSIARADGRHLEALELRRILGEPRAAERQQARIVGLLAVLRPPLLGIDHKASTRTLMVRNCGSLAPCRRAPLSASSRR